MTTAPTMPDADTCVDAIIAADGNYTLAAERLRIPVGAFTSLLASDPQIITRLHEQLRVLTVLKLLKNQAMASLLLGEQLAELEPFELAQTMGKISELVEKFTHRDESTVNVNTQLNVLRVLPPHVRRAMAVLTEADDDALPNVEDNVIPLRPTPRVIDTSPTPHAVNE